MTVFAGAARCASDLQRAMIVYRNAAGSFLSDHPKPGTEYHLKTGQREPHEDLNNKIRVVTRRSYAFVPTKLLK
jgi:hypothetical protein